MIWAGRFDVARIALLGTGLLGSGMVRRFLKNGRRVTVWNRSAEKARALEEDGATAAASAVDAVSGVDHVHIVLSDDRVVDGVLEQIVPALKADAIVIDHSTTLPEETKRRAERMRAKGVRFLHAPVFMSPLTATLFSSGFLLVIVLSSILRFRESPIATPHVPSPAPMTPARL